jgi:hypothetical protein
MACSVRLRPKRMLPRLFRSVVTGLATAAGYVPTPDSWRDRLILIEGEFRRSPAEVMFRLVVEIAFIIVGLYGAIGCLRRYLGGASEFLYLAGMSLVMVALALFLMSLNWVWYRFDNGFVTAFRGSQKILWRENLSGLRYVLRTRGRLNDFITLQWADRKRRIELYASLRKELPTAKHPRSQL